MYDVIIVGSGPSGLSCGYMCKKEGLKYLIIEKGTITESIYNFPISMVFFTTKELIEIGDYRLNIFNSKPSREEALNYYGQFVLDNKLNVKTYEEVKAIVGADNDFVVETKTKLNEENSYRSRKIIVATGSFDNPRMLNIAGEELSKVSHYYKESHLYTNQDVVIIGGRNSAVEAALEIYRKGGRVTMVHRGKEFAHLKYWIEPDILNRIKEGSIKCYYEANVKEIRIKEVEIALGNGKHITLKNDFVLALTGYKPSLELLERLGVGIDEKTLEPAFNEKTYETNISGVYVAGVIVAGNNSGIVFIEQGRFHGEYIIPNIARIIKEDVKKDDVKKTIK